ncbi:MAG: rRNA maturation RNase YbeY [Alphaproteobacteria bacterium]
MCETARRAAGAAVAAALGRGRIAELTVVFDDDAAVRSLNARWRGKDRPTNVLSFPAATPAELAAPAAAMPLLLGDVVLAYETCRAEAEADGKRLADHVAHLVVHGVLHLLGHDHREEAEAERMEALETAILAGLGVADPYADASTAQAAPIGA